MSEIRKEVDYGLNSKFIENGKKFSILINGINNNIKDADTIRTLLQALYNYYSAKQTNTKLPDNELYKIINYFDSNGADPFNLILNPFIREKAHEIITNEVKIKTSGDIFELISRVSKIGDIKDSEDTYTPEYIQNIILALYDYYKIGFNRYAKPEDYSKIKSMISKNEDPFEWLPRTYGIREKARMLIKPKNIIVNETYANLKEGDILLSSGGGHSLYITYDDEFYKFKEKADEFVKDYTNKITRAGALNRFVNSKINYELNWDNNKPVVSISDAIKNSKGVCKEIAAILYMLLASDGYKVYYVRGTLKDENGIDRHAWLMLVDIDGKRYLLDPTNNYYGSYDDALSNMGYKEGENKIERESTE